MSEAKFTPGPWEGKTVLVRGLNFLSHAHYPTELGVANSHLIAAAPELYEALEVVMGCYNWINLDYKTKQSVKKALAKARGEV